MSDCLCHAGKICDSHVEEVMGNLNDRLKDRKNYHDSEEGLMSPNSIDDMPMDGLALQSPTPEQIDHDIIGELSKLRQKVSDLETAKEFNAHIHDNIIKRLNEAERKLEAIEEQFLHFIELRKIKGGFCGCEAVIDIETQHYKIIKACPLHMEWADELGENG